MAQDGKLENRARAKAWTGTWTWPVGVTRPPWGLAWPRGEFAFVAQLKEWATQELAAGRLLPWLAVAYGFGIILYFTAEHEPVWQVAAATAGVCAICTVLLRQRLTAFVVGPRGGPRHAYGRRTSSCFDSDLSADCQRHLWARRN